jgi:Ca2+-binding RTX toxin-like protein
MPASFVTATSTGNALLDGIDGGARWTGVIAYNRVDPSNPAETAAFAAALPSPYTTQGIGLSDVMWTAVTGGLTLMHSYVDFGYELSSGADANYFVSDFYRPDNADVAGIAARPSNTPILAYNRRTWDTYSDQQQVYIVLHELGHTLGLAHVNGLSPSLDYFQYTIMSYLTLDVEGQEIGEGQPLTPMALDIALLQARYGAPAANLGDTRYTLSRFGIDTDGADGAVLNGSGYICIWDTAGTDTLAYGGAASALLNLNAATLTTAAMGADLADVIGDVAATSAIFALLSAATQAEITDPARTAGGFFSSLLSGDHRAPGGYTIANGARVEAASGGAGGDLLIGNAFANTLAGNGGDDNLYGGSGADSLDGGAGDDRAFGGLGDDTVVDRGGGSNYLRGDEGDDSLQGGTGFDDLNGNMGNDTVDAGAGDSWAVGGKDNDLLSGGAGRNLVYGNLGADTCDGGAGDDIVRGGQDNDLVRGGDGADFISGDKGDDTMVGGAGADLFHTFGDAGLDRVLDFSLAEGDRVQLDPGTQFTVAQVSADTVISMTGGGQMILVGVSMSTLPPGWIFGA